MTGRRDITHYSTIELIEILERFNRIIGDILARDKRTAQEKVTDAASLERMKGYAGDVRNELTARILSAAEQIAA